MHKPELILWVPFVLLPLVAISLYRRKGTREYLFRFFIQLLIIHSIVCFSTLVLFVITATVAEKEQMAAAPVPMELAKACGEAIPNDANTWATADKTPMRETCGALVKAVHVKWLSFSSVGFGVIGLICALLQLFPESKPQNQRRDYRRF